MTDDTHGLPRRKVLGALGTIGGAAAIGGAGTVAFFSDDEEFANNRLVAGELDLKLAWQENYFGAAADSTVPKTAELGAFLSQTTVESYPEDLGGNIHEAGFLDREPCGSTAFADAPDDLDPRTPESRRSNNSDTVDPRSGEVKPLIAIQDAKPGDFGFTRFRLLLCDNPGYVWATGGLTSTAENDLTEPERKDPQQGSTLQETDPGPGELAETIRVRLFQDRSGTDAIQTLFDQGGSLAGDTLREKFVSFFELESAPTLAEAVQAFENGNGVPLDANPFGSKVNGRVSAASNDVFFYDLNPDEGTNLQSASQERECFPAAAGDSLGFIWALPVDHANEIQGDAVTVDIGFYTEQCRHNDGSGIGD